MFKAFSFQHVSLVTTKACFDSVILLEPQIETEYIPENLFCASTFSNLIGRRLSQAERYF